MEEKIHILDRDFEKFIPESQIQEAVKAVAEKLNKDYAGKSPVMVCILNGAFMFAADLVRHLTFTPEILFSRFASYDGVKTTGTVRELIGVSANLAGRDVIIVEDIVDTGITMHNVIPMFKSRGAGKIDICTFLQKPDKLQVDDLEVKYAAMEIPNDFIIGYGLDYNGMARNLKDIYKVCE